MSDSCQQHDRRVSKYLYMALLAFFYADLVEDNHKDFQHVKDALVTRQSKRKYVVHDDSESDTGDYEVALPGGH